MKQKKEAKEVKKEVAVKKDVVKATGETKKAEVKKSG